jgi:hypothetical protein
MDDQPFDFKVAESFVPGQTTAKEVTDELGPPRRVVELDVRSAYLYEFSASKNAGLVLLIVNFVNSDVRYNRLWLFFDSRDVLTHYGTQLSAHRTKFAMPWSRSHGADQDAKADAKQKAKEEEARARLEVAEAEAAAAKSTISTSEIAAPEGEIATPKE